MTFETTFTSQLSRLDELLAHYKLSSVEHKVFVLGEIISNRFDGLEQRLAEVISTSVFNEKISLLQEEMNHRFNHLESLLIQPQVATVPIASEVISPPAVAVEPDELKRLSLHTKEVLSQLKTAMAKRTGRTA